MNRFALLAWLLAWPALAGVEPLGFQQRVSPKEVLLGEPFTYELVVTHPKDQRYELEAPGALGAFELLAQSRQRVDGAESATTTFRLELSVFELGPQKLPNLTFEVATEQGRSEWLAPGIEVEAKSSLPPDAEEKGAELHDIHPPEVVPVRTWRLLYALGALLAAGLLGYALYRFLKRPRAAPALPPRPPEPLDVRALAALDRLRAEGLPTQGRVREFYFRLSEILRGYLGERYELDALESTTSELLDALKGRSTPGLPLEELSRFCAESDLAKFAKAPLGPPECDRALELCYRLVRQTFATLPAPPPPSGPTELSGTPGR